MKAIIILLVIVVVVFYLLYNKDNLNNKVLKDAPGLKEFEADNLKDAIQFMKKHNHSIYSKKKNSNIYRSLNKQYTSELVENDDEWDSFQI